MRIIFFLILSLLGCSPKMGIIEKKEFVLGTLGEVICVGNRDLCRESVKRAFQEMERLEDILSYFKKNSDINLLNNSQGSPVSVKEETFEVVKKAIEISQKTEGAFDITVSPLLKIWGFYEREKPFPEVPLELIKEKLPLVGGDKIILEEMKKTVTLKNSSMAIDLGGIAKGYIVDRAIDILKKAGVKNALVNLGGDIFCLGEGKDKRGWRVGIQDPLNSQKIVATLHLKDKAIATSGQYENFREIQGKRFGHIIDPKTGYPVENNILSVTIVADNCLTADALATAIFVLGKEKGESVLQDFSAEAVIITRAEKGEHLWVSPGLKGKISYY